MKVFSISAFMLVFTVALFAQKGAVSAADYELTAEKPNLEKAKEKIDEAVGNEKTIGWPKTYIVKAKVYRALYKQSVEKDEKNPKSELIAEAFKALKKAEELDKKGDEKGKHIDKYKSEIEKEHIQLRPQLINDGVAAYNRANQMVKDGNEAGSETAYAEAMKSFNYVIDVDKMEASAREAVDTSIMFNAAISAYYSKNHEEAIGFLEQLKDMNFGEKTTYLMLYTEYRDVKDTVNMVRILKDGFQTYPEEKVFISDLVVYYINNNKMEEGMEYIDKALESDPSNSGFWFAKANFLDRNGQIEEALEGYNKALEYATKLEDKYNINYNVGVIYYNKAVELYDEANGIENYNEYKKAVKVANDAMKLGIPYFEACAELKPDDKAILENLSSVYYRLSKDDPAMQKKYSEIKKKMDSM